MDLRSASDDELLLATPQDSEAFGEFYRRHERNVLGYLMRRVGDPEMAADLCAETFAAALIALKRFRPGGAPASAWLFGIARNVLGRTLERGEAESRARMKLALGDVVVDAAARDQIAALEGEATVDEWLSELPPSQAEAVRARVIDEDSYPDIARGVSASEALVRQRVSRGLQRLRVRKDRI